MSRYIQRIKLLGKERWIGWDVDGVGTEVPGLELADEMSDEEARARGIKEFRPLDFETFIGMASALANEPSNELLDQDIEYRLDALQVGMERYRSSAKTDVPRAVLLTFFGDERPRVIKRFMEWEQLGAVEFVGREECYLRITGRLA
jgi:hypothetical protein